MILWTILRTMMIELLLLVEFEVLFDRGDTRRTAPAVVSPRRGPGLGGPGQRRTKQPSRLPSLHHCRIDIFTRMYDKRSEIRWKYKKSIAKKMQWQMSETDRMEKLVGRRRHKKRRKNMLEIWITFNNQENMTQTAKHYYDENEMEWTKIKWNESKNIPFLDKNGRQREKSRSDNPSLTAGAEKSPVRSASCSLEKRLLYEPDDPLWRWNGW